MSPAETSPIRLLTAVPMLHRRLTVSLDDRLRDTSVSHAGWMVLSAVRDASPNRPATPSMLADLAGVAPSSMTHRLDKLEQRQLISRTQDPAHGARLIVTLTAEGERVVNELVDDDLVDDAHLFAALSMAERETLHALLLKAIQSLPVRPQRSRTP